MHVHNRLVNIILVFNVLSPGDCISEGRIRGSQALQRVSRPLMPRQLAVQVKLRRDNQDENRATIRMRMRRRGDYEGRA